MFFICKICKSEIELDKCHIHKSACIINKCELIRYECPICGVIFGTLNMINGTVEYIKKAYEFCDTVWKEGDGARFELPTFMSLKPSKEKEYLNFGAGNSSSTIKTLTEQGYKVWGYEPYLPTALPNIIRSKEELAKRKFDGIISSNLIEHLQDPVQDLIFMKSLLKDKTSQMAHATACYELRYEFSLYHLYFFLGKSVEYMSKNAGLSAVKT
ncbi:MAG: methyltransferase domain-containing protein, partial [Bacteroidales bacterium]